MVNLQNSRTTAEAAKSPLTAKGNEVLMGAPNVVFVRGSHSGNIAAPWTGKRGGVGHLSSVINPASLLESAFSIAQLDNNDYDVPKAWGICVSLNPAKAAGLNDSRSNCCRPKKPDFDLEVPERGFMSTLSKCWKNGQRRPFNHWWIKAF